MERNSFSRPISLTRSRRVGRGGKRGKTSGRGGKGQTARAGNRPRPEMRDIIKKLPKRRGYGKNRARTVVPRVAAAVVSLATLSKHFENGASINAAALLKKELIRRSGSSMPPVKILGGGTIDKKLILSGVSASASARAAIEKAGGTIS